MARQRRRGTISKIALARQKVFGEHIATFAAPSSSDPDRTPGFAQRIFPFVRNTLVPAAEIVPSESIIGIDAEPEDQIGQQSGAGDWEFEFLPESILHLLYGWFNPTTVTESDVADQTLGNFDVSGGIATTPDVITTPGQLQIQMPSGTTGMNEVTIEGSRRGSRPSAHRNRFYATEKLTLNAEAPQTTRYFYYGLTRLVMPSAITDDPIVTVKPNTKVTEFNLNTTGLQFPGWTGQMLNASTPLAGFDIIPNGFSVNISDTARLLMNVIASWVVENRVIDNMGTITRQIGTKLDAFARERLNFFQAWGQALAIGAVDEALADLLTKVEADTAEITATTDLTLAGTHNYVDPGGNTGAAFQGQPITDEGSVGNQVNLNATLFHETDESGQAVVDWSSLFFNRSVVPIVVRMYNWASNGRQYIIEFQIPRFQLTDVSGLPIEGRGQTPRTITGKALPTVAATAPDQLKLRVFSENGFKETA